MGEYLEGGLYNFYKNPMSVEKQCYRGVKEKIMKWKRQIAERKIILMKREWKLFETCIIQSMRSSYWNNSFLSHFSAIF